MLTLGSDFLLLLHLQKAPSNSCTGKNSYNYSGPFSLRVFSTIAGKHECHWKKVQRRKECFLRLMPLEACRLFIKFGLNWNWQLIILEKVRYKLPVLVSWCLYTVRSFSEGKDRPWTMISLSAGKSFLTRKLMVKWNEGKEGLCNIVENAKDWLVERAPAGER